MKRFLSWLLTVALVVTMLPLTCVTAYAANYTTSYSSYPAPDASDSAHNGGKNSCTTVSEIKWMQAALNYCIRYKGVSASMLDVDGAFGAASANATKAFQRQNGLYADGWFGSGTIAKMKSVLNVGGSTTTTTATVRTAKVTFNNQGATTAGTPSTTATYGKAMPSITIPKKAGYTFGGYFLYANGVGTQYYTESGRSARSWDRTAATTLYAKWTASAPSGYYNTSYGSYPAPDASDSAHYGGKNSCTTTSEIKWMQAALNYCIKYKSLSATPLTVDGSFGAATANATRAFQRQNGLYADGYFGAGTIAKMKSVLDLTAAAKTTIITFNGQGATTAGTASKTATYGSAMPSIILPKKTGYTFEGYFDSTSILRGVRYYNANGTSARTWNKTGATAVLYARWKPITATVTLNNQGATTAGTTSRTATYDQAMPYITVPRKTGYTFGGYYTGLYGSGTQYYTAYGTSARTWDRTVATPLYAWWKPMTATVKFNNQGATTAGTASKIATYGQAMPTIVVPKKTGYAFEGYFTSANGGGTKYYNANGTSARMWDRTTTTILYAKWAAVATTVTLDDQGATTKGTASVSAYYGQDMPALKMLIKKVGYIFGGFFEYIGGAGTQYYDRLGMSTNVWNKEGTKATLYAKWAPTMTAIHLNNQGATIPGDTSTCVFYGSYPLPIAVPEKIGYEFGGYFAETNGKGTQFFDASGRAVRTWNRTDETANLYAKWTVAPKGNTTSVNPHVLNDGEQKAVIASSVWFECKTYGATDFLVTTGSGNATITVYKKTANGKKEIHSATGACMEWLLSDSAIANYENTYLVHVSAPYAVGMTCSVAAHVDTFTNNTGAIWYPREDSPRASTGTTYRMICYADKDSLDNIRQHIAESEELGNQDTISNVVVSAVAFLGGIILQDYPAASNAFGVAGVLSSGFPMSQRQELLDQFNSVTGYLGEDASLNRTYSRGCVVTEWVDPNGNLQYSIRPWDGGEMTGPRGWVGDWTIPAKK